MRISPEGGNRAANYPAIWGIPVNYTALGTMASLGARTGVAALPNDAVITGFLAWFL